MINIGNISADYSAQQHAASQTSPRVRSTDRVTDTADAIPFESIS
jgi:hypothetical protein